MTIHLADGIEDPKLHAPLESFVLAYAALAPLVAGVGAVWLFAEHAVLLRLTLTWAGAVLCFLSGVRRGLSFRQPAGPTLMQLGTMLVLFALGAVALGIVALGVVALVSPWARAPILLLALGYAIMGVLDPVAARAGEAPRYFARLRPLQMAIPVLALLSLLARG